MIRIAFPFALATLALAACQQPASPPEDDTSSAVVRSAPALRPTAAPPTSSPGAATAIPERFRGVWDNAEGDCHPASDLRLAIGAVSIEFYESLGTVTGVTVESPSSIVVDLAMEGEGERWQRKNRYVLSDDGATLTPSEIGGPSAAAIPRERCGE